MLQRIREENPQLTPNIGGLLYGFLELLIAKDMHHLQELEEKLSRLEEQVLEGLLDNFNHQITALRKELMSWSHYYTQLEDMVCEFEENENEEKLIISYEYTDDDGKQNEGSYNKDSEFYNTELDKIYGEYDKDDLQIHLNDDGKTVEIVDIINNKIVATIDIENLSDIIKRLKIPTSMLVNKRV